MSIFCEYGDVRIDTDVGIDIGRLQLADGAFGERAGADTEGF